MYALAWREAGSGFDIGIGIVSFGRVRRAVPINQCISMFRKAAFALEYDVMIVHEDRFPLINGRFFFVQNAIYTQKYIVSNSIFSKRHHDAFCSKEDRSRNKQRRPQQVFKIQ